MLVRLRRRLRRRRRPVVPRRPSVVGDGDRCEDADQPERGRAGSPRPRVEEGGRHQEDGRAGGTGGGAPGHPAGLGPS